VNPPSESDILPPLPPGREPTHHHHINQLKRVIFDHVDLPNMKLSK